MKRRRDFTVRRAVDGDLDAVAQVWRASALAMDGQPEVPSAEAMRRRVEAELRTGWRLYVALEAGRVVGLLAIKPKDALLDQIFVLPRKQGQGFGRALLDVAKQNMPAGFQLRMAAANAKARRFYEAAGLTLVDEGLHPSSGAPVEYYRWKPR